MTWERVDDDFWWCRDFGTAFRDTKGWWAHRGSYRSPRIEPVVGPYRSRTAAQRAYEKAMGRRQNNQRPQGGG